MFTLAIFEGSWPSVCLILTPKASHILTCLCDAELRNMKCSMREF